MAHQLLFSFSACKTDAQLNSRSFARWEECAQAIFEVVTFLPPWFEK